MHQPAPTSAPASTLPAWITPAWIERVLTTLQPYYQSLLTEQDAVEILLTMGQLFRLLKREEASDEDQSDHPVEIEPDQAIRRLG